MIFTPPMLGSLKPETFRILAEDGTIITAETGDDLRKE